MFTIIFDILAYLTCVIEATVNEGLIKPMKEGAAPRNMRYVPFWA